MRRDPQRLKLFMLQWVLILINEPMVDLPSPAKKNHETRQAMGSNQCGLLVLSYMEHEVALATSHGPAACGRAVGMSKNFLTILRKMHGEVEKNEEKQVLAGKKMEDERIKIAAIAKERWTRGDGLISSRHWTVRSPMRAKNCRCMSCWMGTSRKGRGLWPMRRVCAANVACDQDGLHVTQVSSQHIG